MIDQSSVLFLGDVIPYKPFRFKNNLKTVINLECPVTLAEKPVSGKVSLSVGENHLLKTFGTNLLAVNLANNHILDYGPDGLYSTVKEIEKAGAVHFGVNYPGDNSHNPLIHSFNGSNIAFMSAVSELTTPLFEFDDFNYLTILDTDEISSRIKAVRENVKRVVVYLHWGIPESSYPAPGNIKVARQIIEAGADVVIGSHAHAPQAIEKYRDGVIAYNLGNFIVPAFRNTPSYYDEDGVPLSYFSKRLMPWNRISWGLAINMDTLEYEVRKFLFLADFIVQMKSTPFDKYLDLKPGIFTDSYMKRMQKHIRNRKFERNAINLMYNPFRRFF